MTDTITLPRITDEVEMHAEPNADLAFTGVVTERREVADGVVELTLAAPDGTDLPVWEPGAHIDLVLPDGLVRQYSLCGDPGDRSSYRVAILREPEGRGGSRWLHDELTAGTQLGIQGPRNHFPLHSSPRYLFIAGGIGVTPLLPMVRAAEAAGADWRMVYGGRSAATMSYQDELEVHGERVLFWPEDSNGRIDLESLLGTPAEDTLVYCCGPEPLLAAVEERCGIWPAGSLNIEHFSPAELDESTNTAFEVELQASEMTLQVPADQSILDVVTEAGIFVPTSCTEGTCGSCETPVLEGRPDHRDVVLSPEEQEASETMMICVSRCKGKKLILDL
ncbi:PDR/VanB family oxidoreductase [Gordonia aurantiaca]|uniref:PDR/VanB family oxidoreductase n=1 Tax=Gordonia sp. B21 TaxID=3151852 RepID=UPI003266246B